MQYPERFVLPGSPGCDACTGLGSPNGTVLLAAGREVPGGVA